MPTMTHSAKLFAKPYDEALFYSTQAVGANDESSIADTVVEHLSDVTFIAGTAIEDLAQPNTLLGGLVSSNSSPCPMSEKTLTAIDIGWNYADGIVQIIYGVSLLRDTDNYRRKSNMAKGILNILSGTQLIALTDNFGLFSYHLSALAGATPLAAPAFAFASLCELINASIDLYNADKESTLDGWLDERMDEVEFIKKRIAELCHEREMLSESEDFDLEKDDELAKKIHKFETDQETILNNIASRCRTFCNSGEQVEKIINRNTIKLALEKRPGLLEEHPSLLNECTRNWTSKAEKIADKQVDARIQKQMDENLANAKKEFALAALSFVAMTLAAVSMFVACPPLVVISTIICTALAAYYFQKNGIKVLNHFFSKKPSKDVENSDIHTNTKPFVPMAI